MQNMKDSPSIPQRVLVEQESDSDVLISTPSWLALAKRAGKYDVPLSVLEQVYARGIVTSEPHPKNSPEQQAFHRVDSFIHEGKAYELDRDLTEIKVPDGKKHMGIIKAAIKHHEERNKPEEVNERVGGIIGLAARGVGAAAGGIYRKARYGAFSKNSVPYRAKKLADTKAVGIESEKILDKRYPDRVKSNALDISSKRGKVQASKSVARDIVNKADVAHKASKLVARYAQMRARKEGEPGAEPQTAAPKLSPKFKGTSHSQRRAKTRAGWDAYVAAKAGKKDNAGEDLTQKRRAPRSARPARSGNLLRKSGTGIG